VYRLEKGVRFPSPKTALCEVVLLRALDAQEKRFSSLFSRLGATQKTCIGSLRIPELLFQFRI
jgi:hypothetical protein